MLSYLNSHIGRFLMIGTVGCLIDFTIYRLLISIGILVAASKAIGFIVAGFFAYYANKKYTFSADGSLKRFIGAMSVYIISLILNVSINSSILNLIGDNELSLLVAFTAAVAVSAATNFIGLKYFVFND